MSKPGSTVVQGEGFSFDFAAILAVVEDKLWLVLLLLFIGFIFFIFRKGGFAEKLLESRDRKRELDARQLENLREIADKVGRKYEGDEPFLPLPDMRDRGDKS